MKHRFQPRADMVFLTNCTGIPREKVPALSQMIDDGEEISRRTFLKHVDRQELRAEEDGCGYARHPSQGLTMAGDWHVAYYKSLWEGRPCIFFVWSAIEYIFMRAEDLR